MKKNLILICCIVLFSCSHNADRRQYTRLTYKDFGPPSLAYELIGSDYWQWNDHGDSRPKDYPIAVIVYRDIDLQKIKTLYPVVKEKKQDYRYVTYKKAVDFLNKSIEELQKYKDDIPPKLIGTLKKTRNTIQSELVDINGNGGNGISH